MARPKGTKNKIRTPEEKEQIVLEYLNTKISRSLIASKYEVNRSEVIKWQKNTKKKVSKV